MWENHCPYLYKRHLNTRALKRSYSCKIIRQKCINFSFELFSGVKYEHYTSTSYISHFLRPWKMYCNWVVFFIFRCQIIDLCKFSPFPLAESYDYYLRNKEFDAAKVQLLKFLYLRRRIKVVWTRILLSRYF